ncbi:hypothetical protein BZG36_05475 [Bifiguratus adelaidae]|uniref:Nudix hydrolase domain-containing protein n=1 Tax=Bifiguratus adelaidae TaxID=1938954 RepID=A0A261XSX2_9FUNG|nr:hypothetical protein BZG36_05475 [Bifiguratus adelaidae]
MTVIDSKLDINTQGTAAKIISSDVRHKRFLTIWNRTTKFPDGRTFDWDVVGHNTPNPAFVCVFAFDSLNKTTTLIKEYCQGTNEIKYTCACGGYDRKKHASVDVAAKDELSEEAYLKGGRWINLLPQDQPEGVSEVKWGRNRFVPYLVIDAEKDANPKPRDAEEYMEVVYDIPIDRLRQFIVEGKVMLPSVQTAWMALDRLQKEGLL